MEWHVHGRVCGTYSARGAEWQLRCDNAFTFTSALQHQAVYKTCGCCNGDYPRWGIMGRGSNLAHTAFHAQERDSVPQLVWALAMLRSSRRVCLWRRR